MREHYSPQEIEDGLHGRLSAETSREILRHLLRGCPQCQAAARQRERRSIRASGDFSLPPVVSAAYDTVLDRSEDFTRRALGLPLEERDAFRKVLSFLQRGGEARALAAELEVPFSGLGVCEALLARSWALRYDDPRQMCDLAQAAVEITHALDSAALGPWTVADWAARAWGELANAFRVADRLREAQTAFGKAYELFQKGSGEKRVLMRLLDLEASLLGTLRDFKVAQDRLTLLIDLYRAAGEDHLAGRALVTRALYTYYQGNTDAAYELLQEGIALVDTDRDPSLLSVISHNRLLILVECGRYREAKRLLFDLRSQRESEGRIARLKLRGVEGEIRYGLGEYASAEIIFREVREEFKEIGLSFGWALEGLFLATALLRQGKTEEAMKESLTSAGIFRSLNIHRELLSTVLLLQEALERGQMSVTVLEATTRFLRRKQLELGIG
jgi:tetratricopeptide (TPR) repeat protein